MDRKKKCNEKKSVIPLAGMLGKFMEIKIQ